MKKINLDRLDSYNDESSFTRIKKAGKDKSKKRERKSDKHQDNVWDKINYGD